jgi:hypothetical protein
MQQWETYHPCAKYIIQGLTKEARRTQITLKNFFCFLFLFQLIIKTTRSITKCSERNNDPLI